MAPRGMTAECGATAGRAHDSPVFREVHKRVPLGSGHVILDATYPARANCDVIARSGRDPVICPKKNSRPKGYHAMGTMLKWHRDDPEGFDKAYPSAARPGPRSPSPERGSARSRAQRPLAMRKLRLVLKCVV